jgi:Iron-sulfur cluster-binding domain
MHGGLVTRTELEARPGPASSRLLAETIDELGYQPFLAVELDLDGWIHAVLCPTQNEAGLFVEALKDRGVVECSTFFNGLCAALMQDQAAALEAFCAWLEGGVDRLSVTIDLPTKATAAFAHCVGYPLFRLAEDELDNPASREAALSDLTETLAQTPGNDFLRCVICEALTLALARHAQIHGASGRAREAIDVALTCLPGSLSLSEAGGLLSEAPAGTAALPPHEAPPAADTTTLMHRRMCELPHQPLFAVMIARLGCEPEILTSLTGAERDIFVSQIRGSDAFLGSRFLRAYAAALVGEIYDAGAEWFDWIAQGDDRFELIIEKLDLRNAPFPNANGYPLLYLIERNAGAGSANSEAREAALAQLLDGYETRPGNEIFRNPLLEGLALALSRHLGFCGGRDAEALSYIQRVLRHAPRSIHVKAAENALERRLAGEAVPDRLVKFIGRDNGALKPRICRLPFSRFDIGPTGDVLMCCGHWLPTNIGNFMTGTVEEVLNSPTAQRIRASMLDGSFKYCNHLECGAMVQDTLPFQDQVGEPALRSAIDDGKLTLDGVDEILFAFDQTCNLSCPSCRTQRIIEKPSENEAKADAVERNLVPLLPTLKTLFINPAGELWSSKPSRRLLELVNRETSPDLWLEIISNGTLFSDNEWQKFPNIHDMVRSVRISVDGCTKPTFETLRRRANFEVFCKNMEFLGKLRAQGSLPELKFSFTYQLGNFREMRDFVFFARRFNCDFVIFERLQNLGTFTNDEYRARAVHLTDHPLHQEFLSIVRDPIFRDICVWHEFEWEGTIAHHSDEDRGRWHRASLKYSGSVFSHQADVETGAAAA